MDAVTLQEGEGFLAGLKFCFEDMEDPRVVRTLRSLIDGHLGDFGTGSAMWAEDFSDIQEFGKRRNDSLQEFLDFAMAFHRMTYFVGSWLRWIASSSLRACSNGPKR